MTKIKKLQLINRTEVGRQQAEVKRWLPTSGFTVEENSNYPAFGYNALLLSLASKNRLL